MYGAVIFIIMSTFFAMVKRWLRINRTIFIFFFIPSKCCYWNERKIWFLYVRSENELFSWKIVQKMRKLFMFALIKTLIKRVLFHFFLHAFCNEKWTESQIYSHAFQPFLLKLTWFIASKRFFFFFVLSFIFCMCVHFKIRQFSVCTMYSFEIWFGWHYVNEFNSLV